MLKLNASFTLPGEAHTSTFGILAIRGAGKSNTAAVMAEEFFAAGLPFVVIDPVGSWWGLRSSGDGSGAGLAIAIFGGRHGDIPLEKSGGELIADLVAERRLSCVLDLSEFDSEASKRAFLLAFARRLYQKNTEPLHLFLEEADDYIPQRPMRDEAHLLRAWENIVRRGRARGLGMTIITQRSAAVNKSVLTQVETLFAMRTTSPQDRAAIEAWVTHQGERKDILASLPTLPAGEAWVWSPNFLKVCERVQIRRRRTFDSGATPKHAQNTRPPARMADVDLDRIRVEMKETVERAEANNPEKLRSQIARLQQENRRLANEPATDQGAHGFYAPLISRLESALAEFASVMSEIRVAVEREKVRKPQVDRISDHKREPLRSMVSTSSLAAGHAAILTAVGQHQAGVTREQLTVLTGYKRSSRDTYIQKLRQADLVREQGGVLTVTPDGLRALGNDFQPLPVGDALRSYWLDRLPQGERIVLSIVCESFPLPVSREAISAKSGYQRSSRDTYLQRLAARKLVTTGVNGCRAADVLFG